MQDTLSPRATFFHFPLLTLQSQTGPWVFSLQQFTHPSKWAPNWQAANTFLSPAKRCKWIIANAPTVGASKLWQKPGADPITPMNISPMALHNLPDPVPCKVPEFHLLKNNFLVAFIYIKNVWVHLECSYCFFLRLFLCVSIRQPLPEAGFPNYFI